MKTIQKLLRENECAVVFHCRRDYIRAKRLLGLTETKYRTSGTTVDPSYFYIVGEFTDYKIALLQRALHRQFILVTADNILAVDPVYIETQLADLIRQNPYLLRLVHYERENLPKAIFQLHLQDSGVVKSVVTEIIISYLINVDEKVLLKKLGDAK